MDEYLDMNNDTFPELIAANLQRALLALIAVPERM